MNNGTATFTNSGQSLGTSGAAAVSLGDVNGDGNLDALFGNSGAGNAVWRNNGAGTFVDGDQSLGTLDTDHAGNNDCTTANSPCTTIQPLAIAKAVSLSSSSPH